MRPPAAYASLLLLAGRVFGKKEWENLGTQILHRFAVEEQAPDGFWGEHDRSGPTTGYDYVTMTQLALYWEYTKDPAVLKALRRSTDFHKYFTYPDGTPVEVIYDRNRYWEVDSWNIRTVPTLHWNTLSAPSRFRSSWKSGAPDSFVPLSGRFPSRWV